MSNDHLCVSPPLTLTPIPGGVILFSSGFADAAEHRIFNNKILIDLEYICFSMRVEPMKTGKGGIYHFIYDLANIYW